MTGRAPDQTIAIYDGRIATCNTAEADVVARLDSAAVAQRVQSRAARRRSYRPLGEGVWGAYRLRPGDAPRHVLIARLVWLIAGLIVIACVVFAAAQS